LTRPVWMIAQISGEMDGRRLGVLVYEDIHSFEGRDSRYCLPSPLMGSSPLIFSRVQ
jgi:hypothetical protein